MTKRKCSVDGCLSPYSANGFCRKHLQRVERHGDPHIVKSRRVKGQCKASGCVKLERTDEYCEWHYAVWKKVGLPYRFIATPITWARGALGYRTGIVDGVQLYEHRYLAEKALGKALPAGAEIHHMNGDKADNATPFNLVICPNKEYHRLLEKRTKEYELRQLIQSIGEVSTATGQ